MHGLVFALFPFKKGQHIPHPPTGAATVQPFLPNGIFPTMPLLSLSNFRAEPYRKTCFLRGFSANRFYVIFYARSSAVLTYLFACGKKRLAKAVLARRFSVSFLIQK